MSDDGRDKIDIWLEGAELENALDPELPIVDPHHHIWDRGGHRYMAEEFQADLNSGHNFLATIYVECRNAYLDKGPEFLRPVGETRFVAETLAEPIRTSRGDVAAGQAMIAFADLSLGDRVEPVLDEHRSASQGRLRGVRFAVAWQNDAAIRSHYPTRPGMLESNEIRNGIRMLGRSRLTFDVWAYFTQLDEVARAADACPDTTFVLNHCGGPLGIGKWSGNRKDVFSSWHAGIGELARRKNVVAKLGGLGMPLTGFAFHKRKIPPGSTALTDAWSPYIQHCIDCFGPSRCMFESNWPVDRTAGRYGTVWNAFKRTVADMRASEKQDLFSGTAKRVYRLP